MSLIYMLLFLLACSVFLGAIRKWRGGSFTPQPGPGEDHLVMDKKGRWWRYDEQSNVLEDAFRRHPDQPLLTKSAGEAGLGYVKFLLWCTSILVVIGVLFGRFMFWR